MGVRTELHIGELVFNGLSRAHADRAAASFERELNRLLHDRPPAPVYGDRRVDLLSGLPPLPSTRSPHRLGIELARRVHAGLVDGS